MILSNHGIFGAGGGSVEAGLLPNEVSGLSYWFDTSQITSSELVGGSLSDGAEVSALIDKSGNGATLTPGSSFKRPTYETNELNGNPVLRFVPSDNLVGANTKYDFLHQGNTTVFFVIKTTSTGGQNLFDDTNGESSTSVGRAISISTTSRIADKSFAGTSGQNVFNSTSGNGAISANNWHIVVIRYSQNQYGSDHELYIDGNLIVSSQGTLTPSANTAFTTPKFFSNGTGTNGFSGDVAEFFGYNRALTDEEIYQISGGLNWGSSTTYAVQGLAYKYNLSVKKFPRFISNGATLSIGSDEQVLVTGVAPTLDYPCFPTMVYESSGNRFHLFYKHGSSHNGDADARIMYNRGTVTGIDGNGNPVISWGTPSVLIAAVAGYSLTNPSVMWGFNNRMILKFQLFQGAPGQEVVFVYSDDYGDNWIGYNAGLSPRFYPLMTTDFPPPNSMLATGEGIIYGTELWQPTHADENNTYVGGVYRSSDNGLTWTVNGYMFTSDANDFEEPVLLLRNDNLPLAFLRSGQLNTSSVKYTLDGGATWSTQQFNGFASDSKPSAAKFASGNIVVSGRLEPDASGRRQTLAFSNDQGKSWVIQNGDANHAGISMYASLVHHPPTNRIIAVYSYVQDSGTLTDGPTTMICKILSEQ